MGELAELALLNGPALTKNIDKLVSRGLVQRAVDAQDSRKVLVFISDLGLKTAMWLKERVDAHHHSIEAALGPQKRRLRRRIEYRREKGSSQHHSPWRGMVAKPQRYQPQFDARRRSLRAAA